MARVGKMLGVSGGALAGLAGLNAVLERRGGVESVLGGEVRRWRWEGHELRYTVAGEGPPLLLVHGVYAGASSFEFRKNFGALSRDFRVYALDLLGCGLSERPKRVYVPEDVMRQVEAFAREEVGVGASLVASSLSAALCVPVAVRSPRLFRKLVLICPTGYRSLGRPSGRLGDAVYGLFRAPVVGDTLYHAIVSRRGIRYYLENMAYYDGGLVTDELVESYYRVAHGPGSRYFPAAFVAGRLNVGLATYWPRVPQRALICWGQEARTTPIGDLDDFVRRNPRSAPRVFRDAALLPHDERAGTFNEQVRDFLLSR